MAALQGLPKMGVHTEPESLWHWKESGNERFESV